MTLFKSPKVRFQMSYKQKEAPIYIPMEERLMEDLGIPTRCDLHKYAIRKLHNSRIEKQLAMV